MKTFNAVLAVLAIVIISAWAFAVDLTVVTKDGEVDELAKVEILTSETTTVTVAERTVTIGQERAKLAGMKSRYKKILDRIAAQEAKVAAYEDMAKDIVLKDKP